MNAFIDEHRAVYGVESEAVIGYWQEKSECAERVQAGRSGGVQERDHPMKTTTRTTCASSFVGITLLAVFLGVSAIAALSQATPAIGAVFAEAGDAIASVSTIHQVAAQLADARAR